MSMIVRRAKPSDSLAIAKVHVDTWLTTYIGIVSDSYLAMQSYEKREKMWHNIINGTFYNKQFVYVAEDEKNNIVGFASCGFNQEEISPYEGELNCIYIMKEYQHKGVGKLLVKKAILKLTDLGINSMLLWVFEDNLYARKFYECIGGKKVGMESRMVGENLINEVAYGWTDIGQILEVI